MDYLKNLFGMQGGKRKTRRVKKQKAGACESGEACSAAFSADSSLSQGETFAKMTQSYHGGKSRRNRSNRMRGGAADLSQAFEAVPVEIHQRAGTEVLDQAIAELSKFAPQRGGAAPLTDAFQAPSAELNEMAGVSVLDTAIAQLSKFIPNHNGGSRKAVRKAARKTRRRHGGALGSSPVDANSMLLRPEDYPAAFLNPQWVQENVVNPNFNAPDNAYAVSTGGYRRRNRKSYRKANRKDRKSRKSRKSRNSRKSRSSRKH